jgi:precorrin-6Y C5,15-methyltransferase (decarboxylating)
VSENIDIIGVGADGPDGLRRDLIQRIEEAEFLAGGERHLGFFPQVRSERFVIQDNLAELVVELRRRHPKQRCVVLASGDPLFYGVGSYLVGQLGANCIRIEPSVSSMQLAFARAGIPWQHVALASIHGRDLRTVLLPLLGRPVIGLFTQDGQSPKQVARFFLKHGLADYEALVAESVGAADERFSRCSNLAELQALSFGALNFLILQRRCSGATDPVASFRGLVPGIPDSAFVQPQGGGIMTRQEVRSVLLGKMSGVLQAGDTVWDIGAGLGTVSIEIAVLRPDVEVLAVERDPERAAIIRNNQERFDAYNIRIIEGTAPQALAGEPESPRLVFIGGSGLNLPMILDEVEQRLRAGGRLLANFVTLENLMTTHLRFRAKGWLMDVTEVHVAHSDTLGDYTGLKPDRGVFILRADKPGARP